MSRPPVNTLTDDERVAEINARFEAIRNIVDVRNHGPVAVDDVACLDAIIALATRAREWC